MDAFGRVVATILAVVLLFLFPLKYLAYNQERILDNKIQSEAKDFVENVMNEGYISINMYENFLRQLNQTEQIYDIEMVHSKPLEGYDEVSHRNVLTNIQQTSTSKQCNMGFTRLGVTTKQYKLNNLVKIQQTGSFQQVATHIHTNTCYNGIKHAHSAYGGSCYTYVPHTHTSSCYHTHTGSCYSNVTCGGSASYNYTSSYSTKDSWCSVCQRNVGYSVYTLKCNSCGKAYGTTAILACPHGKLPSTPSCTAIVSKLTCSTSTTTSICGQSSYYSLTCGKTEGYYYNGSTLVNPTCNQVVTSITATNSTQTVLQGNSIVTTAAATYLDGHIGTVTCTNNYANTIGTQTVTLTYAGLVGDAKTTGTRTTSITIITNPNLISCTAGKGHPSYDGTLSECPICKAINGVTISNPIVSYTGTSQGLTVTSSTGAETRVYYDDSLMLPIAIGNYLADVYVVINGHSWEAKTTTFTIKKVATSIDVNLSNSTIYKGQAFPLNYFTVHYNDGSTNTSGIGYILSGFDTNRIGIQNVTIAYDGASTVKTITVLPDMSGLTLTPSKYFIYRGDSPPTFILEVTYEDGTKANVAGSVVTGFNPNMIGEQTIKYRYTENGISLYATCIVKVLPNIDGLTVIPSSTTVYNGNEPTYTIIGTYEDGATKTITSGVTKTGFTPGAGTKNVTFSYTENGRTVTDTITITVKRNTSVCSYGHTYELDDFDSDLGCPICKFTVSKITVAPQYVTVEKGNTLPITVTATYLDGHTNVITSGWTSDFDNSKLGNQLVTITYEGKSAYVSVTVAAEDITCPICTNTYKLNADGSDPGCPICSKTVASISASPETQVVPIESSLDLEVTATYRDGHSSLVTGWTSNFNSFDSGSQMVTIYYQNVTTTVTVIVESPAETTCPICETVYNPIKHPNGCPYCANTVDSIEARLRSGGNLVQLGSEINIAVILIFKDGHRELAYNNYMVEGYEPNVLGNQTITVKYNAYTTSLDIEVVNTLSKIICENGHVYYLNEEGSDLGCPLCSSALNQEETVKEYFNCIYTDEILEKLYTDEIYTFNSGDFITVTVSMKTKILLDKLQNIFMDIDKPNQNYHFGGMIFGPCI